MEAWLQKRLLSQVLQFDSIRLPKTIGTIGTIYLVIIFLTLGVWISEGISEGVRNLTRHSVTKKDIIRENLHNSSVHQVTKKNATMLSKILVIQHPPTPLFGDADFITSL